MVKLWFAVVTLIALGVAVVLSSYNPWSVGFAVGAFICWFFASLVAIGLAYDDPHASKEELSRQASFVAKLSLIIFLFGILCYAVGHYSIDIPSVSEYIPSITVERKG